MVFACSPQPPGQHQPMHWARPYAFPWFSACLELVVNCPACPACLTCPPACPGLQASDGGGARLLLQRGHWQQRVCGGRRQRHRVALQLPAPGPADQHVAHGGWAGGREHWRAGGLLLLRQRPPGTCPHVAFPCCCSAWSVSHLAPACPSPCPPRRPLACLACEAAPGLRCWTAACMWWGAAPLMSMSTQWRSSIPRSTPGCPVSELGRRAADEYCVCGFRLGIANLGHPAPLPLCLRCPKQPGRGGISHLHRTCPPAFLCTHPPSPPHP